MVLQYSHEPFSNFKLDTNKKEFQESLSYVNTQLGKHYPLIINAERIETEEKTFSMNPANTKEVIGSISLANKELVEHAMQSASNAFESWKKWSSEHRANILFRAAAIMRRRKHEFSSYLVKEAGKPWNEADADTAEAIDFLEYYARQVIQLKDGVPVKSRDGEYNQYNYVPLGVGIIISPFNFPLAIMAGTATAAIVTGNTILLKPADATPVIAAKFVEVMEEAGLPQGVLNFVPCRGSEVGDYLVEHPQTRFVSFTGSREVGCRIYEKAAKVQQVKNGSNVSLLKWGGKIQWLWIKTQTLI
ncbi:Aldehyde dehydrogenase family protein [Bacillus sp. OK838]|nr:Aldehyde dehydrogenase family protein [Bacillus sp. OK838]